MESIIIGSNSDRERAEILLKMSNRHGLITGATGTGKTVTLQTLAEQYSRAGVPVVLADVKGDLSGLAVKGTDHPKIQERVEFNNLDDFTFSESPICFWDLYGENGIPLRTTVSEMGPLLLSRVLDLNDIQSDVLNVLFKYADDEGLLLLDLKDLKSILNTMGEQAQDLQMEYGNIAKNTVGAIVRRVLALESAGGEKFFAEPALDIKNLMQVDFSGRGLINIIDAQKLMHDKRLYSSFLMWLLSEFFEELPEVGDPEKPKLVFFFDEAHLLFDDAPKYLIEQIETVIRLIRSKGVGIFFVSQSPTDISPEVLGQLGNKIQHGLRASSEKDRKMIKSVAANYPSDVGYDVEAAILELGIGETLVSCLDEKSRPQSVIKVLNVPPQSQIGPIDTSLRSERIEKSPLHTIYGKAIDRESAFEILKKRKEKELKQKASEAEKTKESKTQVRKSNRQTPMEAFIKSTLRSVGSALGRQLVRGVLGSLKR